MYLSYLILHQFQIYYVLQVIQQQVEAQEDLMQMQQQQVQKMIADLRAKAKVE